MHESLTARAILPAPVRIFGIELLPYSLGHELILVRENNPLVIGGDVSPGDLFESVWICSSRFSECAQARTRISYIPKLWLLKRRARKYNFETEREAFFDYREDGCLELPISDNINPDRSSVRECGAPLIIRLQQFLMTHFRMTEEQAWNYPVGLAKIRWATHWEQQGGIDIYNSYDAECDRLRAASEKAELEEAQCQA